MNIEAFAFGSIRIDGVTYEHDVVIDSGRIHKRKKRRSKPFRQAFGHTPLSTEETIPWGRKRLVIGTGAYGRMPVTDDVYRQAAEREVELLVLPTDEAIGALREQRRDTNAILHVTC